jgi:peptidyl-prolyl cis-trans isomerase D
MLNFFRRQHSKLKWVWVVIIFIFIVTLVTLYIPFGELTTVTITNDVAEVGSEVVTAREFQTAYRNYLSNISSQVSPEMLRAFRFERQILDSLVTRHVMTEEARRLGLSVSAEEIEQRILENPVFREGENFIGQNRYQMILAQNNLTVDEFEAAVRDEILTDKLKSFLTAGVTVGDAEVEEEYRRRNEKATLDYFVIDSMRLESLVTMTDQEQRDYYEKNKATYNVNEKRQAKYIFVDYLKLRAAANVTDEAISEYYDQNKAQYDLPARVRAQHILFKTQGKTPEETEAIRQKARNVLDLAKKGDDFAALARQHSEDSSAASGGDLGTFTRGQMVPQFENAAFGLGVGAISDLVQTEFGFHIIKVNEKEEARSRPLAEIREAIRPILAQRQAEATAADQAQKIAVELATNTDLAAVAQKYGAEVRDTPMIEQGQTNAIPELGNASELERRMFTMTKGEVGTAIAVERGQVVPMLTEIVAAHPASFEEARTRVEADVRAEKAAQMATERSTRVQEAIKSGQSLQAAARIAGAEIKTTEALTRSGSIPDFGLTTDLDKEIFSLPLGKPGTPYTVGGKTIAFTVRDRQEIDPEQMKTAMPALRKEMLPTKREQYFGAYILEARKRMEASGEIQINESVMTQIAQTIG